MELFIFLAQHSGLGLALLGVAVFLAGSILLFAGKVRRRSWFASIALCALLIGGGVWQANGFFDLGIGAARDFTAENWAKTAPADRHFMVSSLRETVALAGMDEAEVRALLGEPDYADTSERLSYIIDTGMDDTTLDLTMANGKVIDISDNNPH